MQLKIDALKEAAARPGAGQRTPVVLASQLVAAGLYQEGPSPAELNAGRGPGPRKGNAMNPRSPYPDVEVPEISLPRFILDRAGVRGTAVPLMGPADPGTATPLMGPATTGTTTPLMGPAAPATVTPLLGPADRGMMVSLMGPADPGTATPLMLPRPVMPRSDRRTDVSPGPAAVRQPGLAAPAGEQITAPGDRR